MSVRSFHSVFMASAVAGAALGCYLVSLRVASERAALEEVETAIVLAERDIRLLETEIGTRARLAQLERWNVRVLSLSAPTADQILGDKFQLARLIQPERKPQLEAPVVLAAAQAPQPDEALAPQSEPNASAGTAGQLLHEASVKMPAREVASSSPAAAAPRKSPEAKPAAPKPTAPKTAKPKASAAKPLTATIAASDNKAGDKSVKAAKPAVTRPIRTANVDPLAPLPADRSTAEASRTNR